MASTVTKASGGKNPAGGGGGKTPSAKGRQPSIIQQTLTYFKESWAETKRATWPSWLQIRQLTIATLAVIIFVAVYLYVWDVVLSRISIYLFRLGR
ncbi:MAG: preprotein translocase subunit SecE [Armatimonadetes bacterium]|nr:preprotein translocase subunit SecE [Armatimonadota bacterium]